MQPRRKASLLWGLVGALSFLVALQTYQLGLREFVALWLVVTVTAVVFVVTTAVAYWIRPRLRQRMGEEN